ncbi:mitochondrial Rho GTPase 1-A-like [Xenia sp. Carnegie-2017]|uniref:mitochondrial Rho GTPase 1-A-like n=1 Tax=Xenia sp. Carnegie-2017 TaxID=2897299 RepID=UPI001F04ECB4|nr:mitochondrial Rho GTPase 1-A-like [Xenia sp. Carnegie-2017]
MKKDVRILLVGEEQVGKTSLILALVSEEFPENVPSRAEEITIPADVTPEQIPTHIVDYSSFEQTPDVLDEEIFKADVICIVYDVTNPETIEKIESYWIPLVLNCNDDDGTPQNKPMILVGNKSDLSEHSTMDTLIEIMNKYSQVKTCIECSAKLVKNISEMFFYAQKSVLYPEDPLYSQETKELTEPCARALTRIFKICDLKGDRILDDEELNRFQYQCFKSPLKDEEVNDVKNCVKRNTADGLKNNGLTLTGFLFLHKLFMERGRHETTWTVLRKFGYGDDLELREDYGDAGLDIPSRSTTELSELGNDFFTRLFEKCDKDKDGALSPEELEDLFSVCPIMPWNEEVLSCIQTNENGWITYDSYIALWVLTTYLDCNRVFSWLSYFGYMHGEVERQLSTAVTVTRSKDVDLSKRQTSRKVFRCNVIGPPGAGRTTLLQGLVNRSLEEIEGRKDVAETKFTINTVDLSGQEKYLILCKITWNQVDIELLNSKKCDVICFLYDQSDPSSFSKVLEHYENVMSGVPCLFIASKSDLPAVVQDSEIQPSLYCSLNNLPAPVPFSALTKATLTKDVFKTITHLAVYPHLTGRKSQFFSTTTVLSLGFGTACLAAGAFLLYKYLRHNKT